MQRGVAAPEDGVVTDGDGDGDGLAAVLLTSFRTPCMTN